MQLKTAGFTTCLATHHRGCCICEAVIAHSRPGSSWQPHFQAALHRARVVGAAAADQPHSGCSMAGEVTADQLAGVDPLCLQRQQLRAGLRSTTSRPAAQAVHKRPNQPRPAHARLATYLQGSCIIQRHRLGHHKARWPTQRLCKPPSWLRCPCTGCWPAVRHWRPAQRRCWAALRQQYPASAATGASRSTNGGELPTNMQPGPHCWAHACPST